MSGTVTQARRQAGTVLSADRLRRAPIACACCGRPGRNRGHGWCTACYARWVYHGRPEAGPPQPGAVTPRRPAPRPPRRFCKSGRHELAGNNVIIAGGTRTCRACKNERDARSARARAAARHDGHDVAVTADGRLFCRTCHRGDHDVDPVAVIRAAGGDAPPRLNTAEREAAVIRLRAWGLPYRAIGERVGCALQTAFEVCKRTGTQDVRAARAWIEACDLEVAA